MTTTAHEQFSDRSRFIAFQVCPRSRYLQYEWGGTGVQRVRGTVPLMTGSYVHAGLADVLTQVMELEQAGRPHPHMHVDVERACKVATDGYRAEVKLRGLDVELGEDAQAVADEQIALTEGLVRAYVRAPGGLEALLRTYRVVEVEREDVWEGFAPGITFQARSDALLQERGSGDLYVLSWKTAAGQDYRRDNEGRHDVQGLSEVAVVERRLRRDVERCQGEDGRIPGDIVALGASYCDLMRSYAAGEQPRIMGVQMVYLIKGVRRQAYDGGPYTTSSSLLRGWYKDGITEREWAWKEETPCPGPGHVIGYTKKGPTLCEGKKFHKLGAGWTKFQVGAPDMPALAEWVEMLASGTVQPDAGDPFEAIVWTPQPYYRQDRDMQSWVRQAQTQEAQVIKVCEEAECVREQGNGERLLEFLDSHLETEQHKRSCDWPSTCQFVPICFGDVSALTAPFATGLYRQRVPHHASEFAAKAPLGQIAPVGSQGASTHDQVRDAANEG